MSITLKSDFSRRRLVFMALAVMLLWCLPATAGGVKERMMARLPQIDAMKAQGVIGENNKGFVEFVGGASGDAAVVEAENADRSEVYAIIAKQQGTTADLVGQRRAKQIEQSAVAGSLVQKGDGSWQKK